MACQYFQWQSKHSCLHSKNYTYLTITCHTYSKQWDLLTLYIASESTCMTKCFQMSRHQVFIYRLLQHYSNYLFSLLYSGLLILLPLTVTLTMTIVITNWMLHGLKTCSFIELELHNTYCSFLEYCTRIYEW